MDNVNIDDVPLMQTIVHLQIDTWVGIPSQLLQGDEMHEHTQNTHTQDA